MIGRLVLALILYDDYQYAKKKFKSDMFSVSNAVFAQGRNTFSLSTNETYFTMRSVHIRRYIARIMIQTYLFYLTRLVLNEMKI